MERGPFSHPLSGLVRMIWPGHLFTGKKSELRFFVGLLTPRPSRVHPPGRHLQSPETQDTSQGLAAGVLGVVVGMSTGRCQVCGHAIIEFKG